MEKKLSKNHIALIALSSSLIAIAGAIAFMKITNRTVVIKQDNKSFEVLQNATEEDLLKYFQEPTLTIVDSDTGMESVANYSELGIKRIIKNYAEIKNEIFIRLSDVDNEIAFLTTSDTIDKYIEKFNETREEHVYPTIDLSDEGFYVTEEIAGKKVDCSKVRKNVWINVGNNVKINTNAVLIERDDTKPTVEMLGKEVDKINNSYITYTNDVKLNATDFKEFYCVKDNQIKVNDDLTNEFIEAVDDVIDVELAAYDTVGKGFEFKTTGGETITIKGGTWGNIFSSAEESKYIADTLADFKSEEDRTPILSQEYASEIGGRYVEVSLKDQHVWFYDNGELVMDSDIVTGTANTSRATPTGVYFISEMIPGKDLRGADYVTWVNRWMRITNRGHGLHDAYWRGSFGGNIYKSNGSHGCINLPKKFAYDLYDKLNVRDCVVIY